MKNRFQLKLVNSNWFVIDNTNYLPPVPFYDDFLGAAKYAGSMNG